LTHFLCTARDTCASFRILPTLGTVMAGEGTRPNVRSFAGGQVFEGRERGVGEYAWT
jgi:hypothetical protein